MAINTRQSLTLSNVWSVPSIDKIQQHFTENRITELKDQ